MRGYTQLTENQRYQIHSFLTAGWNQTRIAREIGVHKSTLSRELRRNRGQRGYRPRQAHRLACERKENHVSCRIDDSLWQEVERLLRLDWSPEQIANRLKQEENRTVSHECIYQYIYADKASGGDLHQHLRCKKLRRKRYAQNDKRGHIPEQNTIDQRPPEVEERQAIGHWEGDTIIGKQHQGCLVTLVERKSRYTVMGHSPTKQATPVGEQVTQALEPHKSQVNSITFDRGREFSQYQSMEEALEAQVYFAHPYASWERGTNENTNGLIRQYFPKKQNLKEVPPEALERVADRLNHRPRKCLGYKTPYEVYFNTSTKLTVALRS